MTRKRPTSAERKARKEERHEIVRSIMQEPDDVVHFPVAFGRIAMSAALWGAVALGILALGVLSSAVFIMRDEIAGLGQQLQRKDVDLNVLSGELQKVRDQMFGEQIEAQQGTITLRLINAETGVASSLSNVSLKEVRASVVSGKYVFISDAEGVLRINLEDGTKYRVVTKPSIGSVAVFQDGSWLAYVSEEHDDRVGVRNSKIFASPLSGRGDEMQVAVSDWPVRLQSFSDASTLVWMEDQSECGVAGGNMHVTDIRNGRDEREFSFLEGHTLGCGGPVAEEYPGRYSEPLPISPDGEWYPSIEVEPRLVSDEYVFTPKKIQTQRTVTGARRTAVALSGIEPRTFSERLRGIWSFDGKEFGFILGETFMAYTPGTDTAPKSVAKTSLSPDASSDAVAAYLSGKFLLVLHPDLAGQYTFRNLVTDTVGSGEGPFTSIAGWSSDLNAVVLLADERE